MGRAAPNDHRRPGTAARPSGRNEAATMAKEAKTNAMRMLERMKISYTPHEYDHDDGAIDGVSVATKLGQDPARVFKTLVTQGASRSYFVFVIPVAAELDLKKAAKSVGEKSVAMIHVADINKVTGYIRGGCSPVGMKKQFGKLIKSLQKLKGALLYTVRCSALRAELGSPRGGAKGLPATVPYVITAQRNGAHPHR